MVRPERRTVRDVRKGNQSMLLRTLYFHGPASRNELTRLTGLSAATVSSMTGDLLAENVVVEAGHVESDGGRPRVILRVNPVYGYAIGVDVADTHVRVELFDLEMNEKAKVEYALRPARHDIELVVRHILAGIDVVLADGGVSAGQVLGVGVGVPGIVERGGDVLVHAKTFGWDGVPLGAMMRAGTTFPVFIDNGAKTMGQAELWFGAGRGAGDAVIVLIGSGVGATVVTDGTTFRGVSSSAGELGHTKIVVNGRICRCGGRGCLEAYVGAEAILDRAGIPTRTADWQAELAGLLETGSPVLAETATYLGVGLSNLINLINPERIVIGGWAGLLLGRHLLAEIRAASADNSLAQPYAATSIVLGRLGPDAVALGAATLVLEKFLSAHPAAQASAVQ
ncbi:ROK family protein [Streptosporangium roseum]|uniref:Transcriptional repressor of the xylose operon n=1 Tax=Streptosporangium roseum (strain ATCC 12428 / DSM 43021 / JCM 3005 / KCTC 9067 / NCIMB 10171 / NRRL 2505 / NI 9100) TaxID=479432 RepID=D2AQS8_STRRD|nr:ROK family protein [Streptosporangium roseum]ACZ86475.1 transcriptional repressor of the xylose operon [Streptosporangium roseum DSM 43021]